MTNLGQQRRTQKAKSGAHVGVDTYRNDKLYPRVGRAVEAILARGKVVAPVDVLVGMGLLDPARLEDWRFGRVPYLERVTKGNLTMLSLVLRILRFHAHDLDLVSSTTAYMRWGKGPKQRLRFSKTGEGTIEEAHSRHFVWPGKRPFHPPVTRREDRREDGTSDDASETRVRGEGADAVETREEHDVSPAEREGLTGWIENWREDHGASPEVSKAMVDAMARYLLHRGMGGGSPRMLSDLRLDLNAAGHLVLTYDMPKGKRVLEYFARPPREGEFQRNFTDSPARVTRYRRSLQGFARFMRESGLSENCESWPARRQRTTGNRKARSGSRSSSSVFGADSSWDRFTKAAHGFWVLSLAVNVVVNAIGSDSSVVPR